MSTCLILYARSATLTPYMATKTLFDDVAIEHSSQLAEALKVAVKAEFGTLNALTKRIPSAPQRLNRNWGFDWDLVTEVLSLLAASPRQVLLSAWDVPEGFERPPELREVAIELYCRFKEPTFQRDRPTLEEMRDSIAAATRQLIEERVGLVTKAERRLYGGESKTRVSRWLVRTHGFKPQNYFAVLAAIDVEPWEMVDRAFPPDLSTATLDELLAHLARLAEVDVEEIHARAITRRK